LPSPQYPQQKSRTDPDPNWRRFIFFRVLFNSRFYYPVLAVLFLDLGLSVAWRWQLWGVLFILPVSAVIIAVGFMASYYLNALADSGQRATVLSFKGLAFNLGYGFNSLLFALLLQAFRDSADPEQALAQGLRFLPPWLIFTLIVLGIAFWRRRAVLRQKY